MIQIKADRSWQRDDRPYFKPIRMLLCCILAALTFGPLGAAGAMSSAAWKLPLLAGGAGAVLFGCAFLFLRPAEAASVFHHICLVFPGAIDRGQRGLVPAP